MTKLYPSLAAAKPALKTLADVLLAVDGIASLSKGRRCDLKTAVRRMAEVFGQAPLDVPVNLSFFQAQLDGFVPADHGMTPKRWSSIKSDFQGALRLTGLADPLPHRQPSFIPPGYPRLVCSAANRTDWGSAASRASAPSRA